MRIPINLLSPNADGTIFFSHGAPRASNERDAHEWRGPRYFILPAWLDAWAGGRLILAEAARHTATCGREL